VVRGHHWRRGNPWGQSQLYFCFAQHLGAYTTYTHKNIQVNTSAHRLSLETQMLSHTCTQSYSRTQKNIHKQAPTHTCKHTLSQSYICTHTDTFTHTNIHTHTAHTHMYTQFLTKTNHIHSHTHVPPSSTHMHTTHTHFSVAFKSPTKT
jgi:hypothetical protein